MASKTNSIFFAAIGIVALVSYFAYFEFSVDDAYILARYAHNLVETGSLVYNIEHPLSAMTSPLQALLYSIIYFIFRSDPVYLWKFFAIILLLHGLYLGSRLISDNRRIILYLIVTLLSPSIMLWSVAGLETISGLYLVTLLGYLLLTSDLNQKKNTACIGLLFGLLFLNRFDSILFLLPIGFYLIWQHRRRPDNILLLIVVSFAIPIAWLIFSQLYYGHILPTSYFYKKPGFFLLKHAYYTLVGLCWIGALPLTIYFFISSKFRFNLDRNAIVLYVGIVLVLIYALNMSGSHMMFGFRIFVPFMPLFFALLLRSIKRTPSRLLAATFLIAQIVQIVATYNLGINFPLQAMAVKKFFNVKNIVENRTVVMEYAYLNIPTYISFMESLKKQSLAIKNDWETLYPDSDRPPKIFTYAEGIAAYYYPSADYGGFLVNLGNCEIPDYLMDFQFSIDKSRSNSLFGKAKPFKRPFLENNSQFYIFDNWKGMEFLVFRVGDMDVDDYHKLESLINKCNSYEVN